MLAEDRLDGFERRADDGRMDESEDRAEAVAFAKAAHASGEGYKSIAKTLRLKPDTLMRWCRRGREPKKFARVVVNRVARSQWTVHGPAGTRIEALSMEQVVELFGALCCSG